jgi:alkylation response protein AidB-like acyl-CoA dehydrogenase
MYIAYPPELEALQVQLRGYFDSVLTVEEKSGGEVSQDRYAELRRRLGSDGWLGLGWPTEYGGQGRSEFEQYVFFDEARRAGMPVPMLALNTVGPTLMHYGTQQQKDFFLPRILSGEIDFAIGYTEPEAGTDLAALRTTARRDGDSYVVNGLKIFTSGGSVADYIWLAVRTDQDAPKHKGLSLLIVPTASPGFSVTPLPTISEGGVRATTTTYYDDVVVPAGNLVGPENTGWRIITSQLNHERVALAASRSWILQRAEEVREWVASAHDDDGRRVVDDPAVRLNLARVDARLEAMKLLNWRLVATLAAGTELGPADAAAAKIYGTEALIEACRLLLEVLGPLGYRTRGSAGAVLGGQLEHAYRAAVVGTFGGGNNDVLREMIANRALGMTRVGR